MRQKAAGFTLMEVMITVAIVAILASIALASYRSQIVRSNRSAAESFMQDLSGKEERWLLDNRQYTATVTNLSTTPSEVSANYTITIATTSSPPSYTITATPIVGGAQARDDTACGTLTLDSKGTKGQSGSGTRCWQ